jgi:MFS superfamily sulfate permease-like transporter
MKKNNTKVEKTSTTKNTNRRKSAKESVTTTSPIQERMAKLETAYIAAISGEIKFGEVKSIFKQLHKEIKKSAKSKS